MTLAPVMVMATFAKARPARVLAVMVMEPPMGSPARMLPLNAEVVRVTAALGAQNTLQGTPPPAMTTEKLVAVSAPLTRNTQTPVEGPLRVKVPALATASRQ